MNPWAQLLERALALLGAARTEIAALQARLTALETEQSSDLPSNRKPERSWT